jgi:hypothetical protein
MIGFCKLLRKDWFNEGYCIIIIIIIIIIKIDKDNSYIIASWYSQVFQ